MTVRSAKKRQDILGLDPDEVARLIEPVAPKRYNARQVFGWVYAKGVFEFASMHNLSKALRKALAERFCVQLPVPLKTVSSERARVSKYLLSLSDGSTIECVLIGMRDKNTFCISTQVGCRFRCAFCATGRMGFKRNLTAAEILGQVLFLRSASERAGSPGEESASRAGNDDTVEESEIRRNGDVAEEEDFAHNGEIDNAPKSKRPPTGSSAHDGEASGTAGSKRPQPGSPSSRSEAHRAFNVVFMGMGEPLDNYENTVKAMRVMQHPDGLAIGGRRITVSTCGIPDKIKRLAREELGVGLALSLNATTDALRSKLVPAGREFGLKQVLEATRYFAEKSGRRVTLEYVLISGVNDRPADARRLASIASSMPCKINLIEVNPSPGVNFEAPSKETLRRFIEILYPRAPAVTLRKSKGGEIMAACGQLRTDITTDRPATQPRAARPRPRARAAHPQPTSAAAKQERTHRRPRPERTGRGRGPQASAPRRTSGTPRSRPGTDTRRGRSPTGKSHLRQRTARSRPGPDGPRTGGRVEREDRQARTSTPRTQRRHNVTSRATRREPSRRERSNAKPRRQRGASNERGIDRTRRASAPRRASKSSRTARTSTRGRRSP